MSEYDELTRVANRYLTIAIRHAFNGDNEKAFKYFESAYDHFDTALMEG